MVVVLLLTLDLFVGDTLDSADGHETGVGEGSVGEDFCSGSGPVVGLAGDEAASGAEELIRALAVGVGEG